MFLQFATNYVDYHLFNYFFFNFRQLQVHEHTLFQSDMMLLVFAILKLALGMRIFNFVNFKSLIYMKLYNLLILNKIEKCKKTMLRH